MRLLAKNNDLQHKLTALQNKYTELARRQDAMAPITNNTNTTTNNNTNSHNNITNHIQINNFGSEVFDFTPEEIQAIIDEDKDAIIKSIETLHFSETRPQNRNVKVTNLRSSDAHIFRDGMWIVVPSENVTGRLVRRHARKVIDILEGDTSPYEVYDILKEGMLDVTYAVRNCRTKSDEDQRKEFEEKARRLCYNNRK